MKHLFSKRGEIERLFKKRFILILLDFDGTLSTISQEPSKAIITKATKELLRRLSGILFYKLAIISGRSLEDIQKKVGLADIIYVGNHGLELKGPKIKFTAPISAKYRVVLKQIKDELRKNLSGIKGFLLEDKGLSLSLHYRLVKNDDLPRLKTIFHEATATYLAKGKIKKKNGKKVFEIAPPIDWDKGKVALWLIARQQFREGQNKVLPIYIGDDVTDEDAFRALRGRGLTVFVGKPKRSYAQYYLKNPKEVIKFLQAILTAKEKA